MSRGPKNRVPKVVGAAVRLVLLCSCFGGLVREAGAQYPGVITKKDKPEPVLRSVAVLEWTGEAGKPSASRVIPVSVYDGEQLNDGTIYLNRPEPLALAGGVEYELQTDGKPTGIFDIFGAGNVDGSWQGVGVWKPLSAAETKKAEGAFNTSSMMNGGVDIPEDDDKPVLHRKHPKGTDTDDAGGTNSTTSSGTGSGTTASKSSADDDPDRPKLKRKPDDTAASSGSGTSSTDTAKNVDPDRPTIRRARHAEETDLDSSRTAPDPDRPRLRHGKPDNKTTEAPRLEGLPPTMQQEVAVSDARSGTEHPFKYKWANPEDANKMKVAMEAIARTELGMDTPAGGPNSNGAKKSAGAKSTASKAAGAANTSAKTATTGPVRRKNSMLASSSEPVALTDEKFEVFELTYGSTATMVLTASTPAPAESAGPTAVGAASGSAGLTVSGSNSDSQDGPPVIKRGKPASNTAGPIPSSAPQSGAKSKTAAMPAKPAPQKFVTIIAQPDLYGGVKVLYKYVTDAAHLDERPRMRLVDAVDAMGDNRGELLFELRGQTQRQFAMYRVMRGTAEQLFATGAAATTTSGAEVN